MAAGNKPTREQQRQFNLFVKECKKWQPILAPEYDIVYMLKELDKETYAEVNGDSSCGTAEVVLNITKLDGSFDKEIRRTAFEEIAHLMMADYRQLCSFFINEDYIDRIEHRIINKFKTHLIK